MVSILELSRLISGASCFRPQRQAASCQEASVSQMQGPGVWSFKHPHLGPLPPPISPGLWRKHTTSSSNLSPVPPPAPGPTLCDLLQDFKYFNYSLHLPNLPSLPLHLKPAELLPFAFFSFPFFQLHCRVWRILVPRPRIEPVPSAVRAQSPNHWIIETKFFPSKWTVSSFQMINYRIGFCLSHI